MIPSSPRGAVSAAGPVARGIAPVITASIVTYRSSAVIASCVNALFRSTRRPLELVVFDNASGDGTVDRLAPYSERIRLIRSHRNVGFGRGHNTALFRAREGYFLLLNPDVELTPGSLDLLAAHLDAHPECGAVAPRLAEGRDRKLGGFALSYPGQRFLPVAWNRLPGRIAFLECACVLVRSEIFRRIGGFDRRYFLYAENLDLSLQIRRAGYTLECLGDVIVRHLGGYSEASRTPCAVAFQKYGALLQFYDKNYPKAVTRRLVLRDLLRFSFRWSVQCLGVGAEAARKADQYRGRLQAWNLFMGSQLRARVRTSIPGRHRERAYPLELPLSG